MSKTVTRISDLCPAQRALVEEMQRIRYGTIEWLAIRDGLPEFVADTLCLPAYQIVGSNGPHPASDRDDTVHKAKVVTLLERFRQVGHGLVRVLKVVDGLPTGFILEERPGGGPSAAVRSLFPPVRPPVGAAAVNKIQWGR